MGRLDHQSCKRCIGFVISANICHVDAQKIKDVSLDEIQVGCLDYNRTFFKILFEKHKVLSVCVNQSRWHKKAIIIMTEVIRSVNTLAKTYKRSGSAPRVCYGVLTR